MTGTPSLTPREIVEELDRYVVGQREAKRAVAIALRNRFRRQQIVGELRDEILPKNIIMVGPTGVGKTEIARRLAKLAQAPFVKVEASKFTEVGYVGRDVDSMVRDLVEESIKLLREEESAKFKAKAREVAEERLLDILTGTTPAGFGPPGPVPDREMLRAKLRAGTLDEQTVELDLPDKSPHPFMTAFSGQGMEEISANLEGLFGTMMPKKMKRRKARVEDAFKALSDDEAAKMVDMEKIQREALHRAEQSGIIFIDEIDKIASREKSGGGAEVSREGVQRDILPIVEGSTVTTKYGTVRTDHILFIAAGAFHVAKPSDLIPELQGRFPIRVELTALSREDLVRILTEPKGSLVRQYTALLNTEGLKVQFQPEAIEEIARVAQTANERAENIGARRLHAVMERLLDELSFGASDMSGQQMVIDAAYVREKLDAVLGDEDLSKYIL